MISYERLDDLFYDCKSWHRLNNGNHMVDIKELIKKLEEEMRKK